MANAFAPVAHDLGWLGSAPSLLKKPPSSLALIHETAQFIHSGKIQIPVEDWEHLGSLRGGPLGRYFEALVQVALRHCPEIDCLHANIPIRDGGRTFGEFDLLYKRGDQWVHLEMAVKFYLGVGDLLNPDNWHGPALRDNLGRKWRHMTGRQLVLSDQPEARTVLRSMGIEAVQPEPMILGRLFHPLDQWLDGKRNAPEWISESHESGWWCRESERPDFSDGALRQLTKPEWLAPAIGNAEYIVDHVNPKALERPYQFALMDRLQGKEAQEKSRGFIVPNAWGP